MRSFYSFSIILFVFFSFSGCAIEESNLPDDESGLTDTQETSDDSTDEKLCGNSFLDAGEECDGGAMECATINSKYTGGIATCKTDCSGWIESDCKTDSADTGNTGNTGDTGNTGNTGDTGNTGQSGFDKNAPGIWVDPDTYLIWENPMGNKGAGGMGPKQADAVIYCENLFLAGADDWRLPTISELRTIARGVSTVAKDGKCPTTDTCTDQDTCNKDKDNTQGFGNSCLGCYGLDEEKYNPDDAYLTADDCLKSDRQLTNESCYRVPILRGPCNGTWSSTPNTGTAGSLAKAFWYLNFKGGLINSDSDTLSGANWVRCVRAGTEDDVPETDYTPPNDLGECIFDDECEEGEWCEENTCVMIPENTWTDTDSGLIWQAGLVENRTWQDAVNHCEALDYEGFSDWRLPNLDELKSLVKGCSTISSCEITSSCTGYTACHGGTDACDKGCGKGNYLPPQLGQQNLMYWTSDVEEQTPKNAWLVDFSYGTVKYLLKTWDNKLGRCVRGEME